LTGKKLGLEYKDTLEQSSQVSLFGEGIAVVGSARPLDIFIVQLCRHRPSGRNREYNKAFTPEQTPRYSGPSNKKQIVDFKAGGYSLATEKIGEGLVRIGAMTEEQRNQVIEKQNEGDDRMFGEVAIEMGYINDEIIMEYINSRFS